MSTESSDKVTRCRTCDAPAHATRRAHLPRMTGTVDVVTIGCETGHFSTVPALLG